MPFQTFITRNICSDIFVKQIDCYFRSCIISLFDFDKYNNDKKKNILHGDKRKLTTYYLDVGNSVFCMDCNPGIK